MRGEVRRTDKRMPDEAAWEMLASADVGRIGTVGADGWPYVTPVQFVVLDRRVYVHHVREVGHLNANLSHDPRVCFEVDDSGPVVAGNEPGCSSTVAYRSVVAYGRIAEVRDDAARADVCAALMAKYVPSWSGSADGFAGRMGGITVYALDVDWITGKQTRPGSGSSE